MNDEIKLLSSIFFISLIILNELFRKRKSKLDFFSYFTFYFMLMYLFPYITWQLFPENAAWDGYRFGLKNGLSLFVLFSMVASFVLVYVGFIVGGRVRFISILAQYPVEPKVHKILLLTTVLLLMLVAVVLSFGGLSAYLVESILSRSDESNLGLAGYFGYFLSSMEFLSYVWLGLYIAYRRKIYVFLFAVCFFSSMLISLSTGSRAAIIYPLLFLLFFIFGISKKSLDFKSLILAFSITLIGVYAISEARIWYYDLSRQTDLRVDREFNLKDAVILIPAYFKHYLITIERALADPFVYQAPRLWIDYFRAAVSVLPGFGWNNGTVDFFGYTHTIAVLNRDYLGGNGYVPAGWIASALINASFLGLIIQSLVAGFVGGVLNRCFLKNIGFGATQFNYAICLVMMTLWYRLFFAQDPWQVFLPNFGIFLLALTLVSLVKFKVSK